RAQADRRELDAFEPSTLQRPLEQRRGSLPFRQQEAHGFGVETPRGERDRLGRRRVEPLDVVDRDDERAPGGEGLEYVQKRERDRPFFRRRVVGLRAEERHVERAPLWIGDSLEDVVRKAADEV